MMLKTIKIIKLMNNQKNRILFKNLHPIEFFWVKVYSNISVDENVFYFLI